MDANHLGYAIGTVLAGYLMVLPFYAVGWVWNYRIGDPVVNPWALPSLVVLLIVFCFGVSTRWFAHATPNDHVVLVGMIPAIVGVWGAGLRHRSRKPMIESV